MLLDKTKQNKKHNYKTHILGGNWISSIKSPQKTEADMRGGHGVITKTKKKHSSGFISFPIP